jgi:hypothetical protein
MIAQSERVMYGVFLCVVCSGLFGWPGLLLL